MKQIIRRVAALVIGLGLGAGALAGLETVTHISDLNASWPLGSDLASTSDDHIRNIKTALKTDFPNINAAVTATPAEINQLTTNTFTSAVLFSSGTAGAPGISFSGDTDTGFYHVGANTGGFAAGGVLTLQYDTLGIYNLNGTATNPAYTFSGDADTGFYHAAANTGGFAAGGALTFQYDTLGMYNLNGTATNPSYTFSSDTSTGIYRAGASDIGFSAGGSKKFDVTSSGVTVTGPATFGSGAIQINGASLTIPVIMDSTATNGSFFEFTNSSVAYGYLGAAKAVMANTFGASAFTAESAGILYLASNNAAFPSMSLDSSQSATIIQGRGPSAAALVDMTPDTGTFTATMTGGSTSPTCTARWTRVGNLVMLEICSATATSNATSFTYTGLPSAVQPTVTQHVPAASSAYEDNGTAQPSTVEVVLTASSGTITFWHNGASTGWTNTGVKGVLSINTVSYLLN